MKRKVLGLYLTPDGALIKTPLEVRGRALLSKKLQVAYVQEADPFAIAAARRGRRRPMVLVTREHMSPLRPPWVNPTADAPEQKGLLRENIKLAGPRAMKQERNRTDALLLFNMIIVGGSGLLFALVTVASLDIGGLLEKFIS